MGGLLDAGDTAADELRVVTVAGNGKGLDDPETAKLINWGAATDWGHPRFDGELPGTLGHPTEAPIPDPFAIFVAKPTRPGQSADPIIACAAPGVLMMTSRGRTDLGVPLHRPADLPYAEPYDIEVDVRESDPALVRRSRLLDTMYVVERLGHRIRAITLHRIPESELASQDDPAVGGLGMVLAGTGEPGPPRPIVRGRDAQFNEPHDACLIDGALIVCDTKNHVLRRIDLRDPLHTVTVFGDQQWDGQRLRGPRCIVPDDDPKNPGGFVIAYREANRLFVLNADGRVIRHLAGSGQRGYTGDGGPATAAALGGPKGLAISPSEDGPSDIYFADTENNVIRRIERASGTISTIVGDGVRGDGPDGPARSCRLGRPHGIAFDGTVLLIADTLNNKVRAVDTAASASPASGRRQPAD